MISDTQTHRKRPHRGLEGDHVSPQNHSRAETKKIIHIVTQTSTGERLTVTDRADVSTAEPLSKRTRSDQRQEQGRHGCTLGRIGEAPHRRLAQSGRVLSNRHPLADCEQRPRHRPGRQRQSLPGVQVRQTDRADVREDDGGEGCGWSGTTNFKLVVLKY